MRRISNVSISRPLQGLHRPLLKRTTKKPSPLSPSLSFHTSLPLAEAPRPIEPLNASTASDTSSGRGSIQVPPSSTFATSLPTTSFPSTSPPTLSSVLLTARQSLLSEFDNYDNLLDVMEGKGDKVRLAKDIIGDVSKRLAAEEEVLGGVYQKLLVPSENPPRDLYKEWVDGHYRLKVTLQRLEFLSGDEPSFDQEIRTLAEELRTQTNFEAIQIIPHLEDLHLPVETEDVELALRVAEESISPHPHPNAPMTPPTVAKITNRVLKFIDQGRGKVAGSLGGFVRDGGS